MQIKFVPYPALNFPKIPQDVESAGETALAGLFGSPCTKRWRWWLVERLLWHANDRLGGRPCEFPLPRRAQRTSWSSRSRSSSPLLSVRTPHKSKSFPPEASDAVRPLVAKGFVFYIAGDRAHNPLFVDVPPSHSTMEQCLVLKLIQLFYGESLFYHAILLGEPRKKLSSVEDVITAEVMGSLFKWSDCIETFLP